MFSHRQPAGNRRAHRMENKFEFFSISPGQKSSCAYGGQYVLVFVTVTRSEIVVRVGWRVLFGYYHRHPARNRRVRVVQTNSWLFTTSPSGKIFVSVGGEYFFSLIIFRPILRYQTIKHIYMYMCMYVCIYMYVCVCCLLYTSPSPRDVHKSRMPSSA